MRDWKRRVALAVGLALAGCGSGEDDGAPGLTGSVTVDGSSTVAPISEAIAEDFQLAHEDVRVTVGIAGTGGGFKRFCAGETDVADASRPISGEERAACAAGGVAWLELPVAWDGLSVVVNPLNDFVTCLTVEELKRIWEPNSTVASWRDVRPEFPAEPIQLYGPGTDSGTFDYFTEVIVGEAKASRPDYQASEDDNVLVQGVAGDRYALGYFGHAYAQENADKVRSVGVDGGSGCVVPTGETITGQTYSPLSRRLYIYVSRAALARPVVREFLRYYMVEGPRVVPSTGYLALDPEEYERNLRAIGEGASPVSDSVPPDTAHP